MKIDYDIKVGETEINFKKGYCSDCGKQRSVVDVLLRQPAQSEDEKFISLCDSCLNRLARSIVDNCLGMTIIVDCEVSEEKVHFNVELCKSCKEDKRCVTLKSHGEVKIVLCKDCLQNVVHVLSHSETDKERFKRKMDNILGFPKRD